ncbi:MAG: hypothetical protein CM15mP81_10910 [Alphaproteobacteria bacterium]|nr:MAG: hypothetical protein CM15mP81_10910 [Alphaproteobacteria bacterium]
MGMFWDESIFYQGVTDETKYRRRIFTRDGVNSSRHATMFDRSKRME